MAVTTITREQLKIAKFVGENMQMLLNWAFEDEHIMYNFGKTDGDYVWVNVLGTIFIYCESGFLDVAPSYHDIEYTGEENVVVVINHDYNISVITKED